MFLAILGASGKFGSCIHTLAKKDPNISSIYPASRIRQEGFFEPQTAIQNCDLVIDSSSHEATKENLEFAIAFRKPIVIGTTGHPYPLQDLLTASSKKIPIFYAANFSIGVYLLIESVRRYHEALPQKQVKVEEVHHISKQDKPSGTALLVVKQMPELSIPIISHRTADGIPTHTIDFSLEEEEVLSLSHKAYSRNVYAKGALKAAHFLLKKPPGLYSMADLLSNN